GPGRIHPHREAGIGSRMSHVEHQYFAHQVTGEQVSATKAAERDGQACGECTVVDPGLEVESARTVDRHTRNVERAEPLDHRGDVALRGTAGAGAEHGVDDNPDAGPALASLDHPYAVLQSDPSGIGGRPACRRGRLN